MTTILSVDWDYFFPKAADYDWAHREADFFLDLIWTTRVASRNIFNGDYAFDHYIPSRLKLKGFWGKVCPNPPGLLVIAESHSDMYKVLELYENSWVINYDAHHDFAYNDFSDVACDNWAYFGHKNKLISQYDLVVPPWWRKKHGKVRYGIDKKIKFHHELISCTEVDALFICRSSAWTPPWWDDEWLKFINHWQKYPELWSEKIAVDYVLKARDLDREEAKKLIANPIL